MFWLLALLSLSAQAQTPVDLNPTQFRHLTFDKIPATNYRFDAREHVLKMHVQASASFLFQGFEKVKNVQGVQFLWQSPQEKIFATEEDDFLLRIGLVLKGDKAGSSFFMPAWVKLLQSELKYPVDRIIFLVIPAAKTQKSSDMQFVNLALVPSKKKGWQIGEMKFDAPQQVAGLWLMADGDNSKSNFESHLRDLILKEL